MTTFQIELQKLITEWIERGDDTPDMHAVLLEEAEHLARSFTAPTSAK